jgi:hypothetical protein
MQTWRYDEEEVVRLLEPVIHALKDDMPTQVVPFNSYWNDLWNREAFSLLFRSHLNEKVVPPREVRAPLFGRPVQLRLLGLSRGTLETTLTQQLRVHLLPKDHPTHVFLLRVLQFCQYLVDHPDLLSNIPASVINQTEAWNGWTGLVLQYEPDEIWSTDKSYRALFNAAIKVQQTKLSVSGAATRFTENLQKACCVDTDFNQIEANYPIQAANALSPSSKPVVGGLRTDWYWTKPPCATNPCGESASISPTGRLPTKPVGCATMQALEFWWDYLGKMQKEKKEFCLPYQGGIDTDYTQEKEREPKQTHLVSCIETPSEHNACGEVPKSARSCAQEIEQLVERLAPDRLQWPLSEIYSKAKKK